MLILLGKIYFTIGVFVIALAFASLGFSRILPEHITKKIFMFMAGYGAITCAGCFCFLVLIIWK